MNAKATTLALGVLLGCAAAAQAQRYDYRLLATSRTSTMEKEMNQAAETGYTFGDAMGGESAMGGKEVIVVMVKNLDAPAPRRRYKLVATSRTGTLQKELQQAGDEGFQYCAQTVFQSAIAGREVAVILEHSGDSQAKRIEFKLLATNRTSTMEKELRQAGEAGFKFLGVVVGKTAFGGSEVISILQKTDK
ncbi:MAG: hypothetical protein HY822_18415 [Acidobacteria bacterium]|nr:hypothetical protein [Acidobacteriota bacterium]